MSVGKSILSELTLLKQGLNIKHLNSFSVGQNVSIGRRTASYRPFVLTARLSLVSQTFGPILSLLNQNFRLSLN